jgi:formate hydrogenlyase subunit 6/NADH:ubiquinone oxidoreductase subunit I
MGRSFLPYSLGRVVRIRKASNVPVIGVGGIYEAQDALQYILCGECQTTCIYNVFKVDKGKKQVSIDEDRCWSCGFCVGICPTAAIELRDRINPKRVIWNNQGLAEPHKFQND